MLFQTMSASRLQARVTVDAIAASVRYRCLIWESDQDSPVRVSVIPKFPFSTLYGQLLLLLLLTSGRRVQ